MHAESTCTLSCVDHCHYHSHEMYCRCICCSNLLSHLDCAFDWLSVSSFVCNESKCFNYLPLFCIMLAKNCICLYAHHNRQTFSFIVLIIKLQYCFNSNVFFIFIHFIIKSNFWSFNRFRATLNFRKLKVFLNLPYSFFTFGKFFNLHKLIAFQ